MKLLSTLSNGDVFVQMTAAEWENVAPPVKLSLDNDTLYRLQRTAGLSTKTVSILTRRLCGDLLQFDRFLIAVEFPQRSTLSKLPMVGPKMIVELQQIFAPEIAEARQQREQARQYGETVDMMGFL